MAVLDSICRLLSIGFKADQSARFGLVSGCNRKACLRGASEIGMAGRSVRAGFFIPYQRKKYNDRAVSDRNSCQFKHIGAGTGHLAEIMQLVVVGLFLWLLAAKENAGLLSNL